MRIQRLENQLRQLTGQNEELQYRNRQLEERLRQLGGAPAVAGGQPPVAQPGVAAVRRRSPMRRRPPQGSRAIGQPQPGYPQPQAAMTAADRSARADRAGAGGGARRPAAAAAMPSIPARIRTRPARRARSAAASCRSPTRRRSARPAAAEPASRSISAQHQPARIRRGAPPPPRAPGAGAALTTLPPSATPKDEFDLGIGYMQRKDYALAEETMQQFRAEISERSRWSRMRNTGSARAFSSASNIATPRKPSSA